MRQPVLGVVYTDGSLLLPVEGGEDALRVSLKDPTIPQSVRAWVAENFSALVRLIRALGGTKGTWIRIPLDGEWSYV
jgi:hypothetical protein